jgi:hypothetical protein
MAPAVAVVVATGDRPPTNNSTWEGLACRGVGTSLGGNGGYG